MIKYILNPRGTHWKRFLKNTIFLCPNGHQKCTINPIGYQWFDLSKDDENYILSEAKKAESILPNNQTPRK